MTQAGVPAGDGIATLVQLILGLMRLVMFALALGLTLISYQSYSERGTKQLETAFIGFAFISMGVGVSALISQVPVGGSNPMNNVAFVSLQIVETIPFIVGFAMLYLSLYR